VHVCQQFNETSEKTTWQIPESHFLEEWGDTRAYDGIVTIIQPLIAPLYGTRSALTVLDAMLNFPGRSSYDIVRAFWMQRSGGAGDFEQWWRKSVHDGLVPGTALPRTSPALPSNATVVSQLSKADGLEIVFRPDVYLYGGRYANNIWLQELPHPMTKPTWDNAVFLSPETAAHLGLANQQHVEVRYRGHSVRGSIWILHGHPNNSVGLDFGLRTYPFRPCGKRRGVQCLLAALF
jgi:molybdopterin-containing oxidoreductase family iron-sulfur binding subunit